MRETGLITGICVIMLYNAASTYAGRPARIDDADPVGAGRCELESGINYIKKTDCRHWDYPFGFNYGIASCVELSCGLGGQFEESTEDVAHLHHEGGLCDLIAGTKIRVIDEGAWMPRQAISAAVKFPVADEEKGLGSGETDYDLTWIISKALSSRIGAHLNAGYSWIGEGQGEDAGDVFHYGVGVDLQLCDRWQLVVEVFCENELISGAETLLQCNTGIRWEAMDCLVFDAAAGAKLHGDVPDATAAVGLTWKIGGE